MSTLNWKAILAAVIGGAIPAVMDSIVSGETDPNRLGSIFLMSALASAKLYLMRPEPKPKEEPPPVDPGGG